MIADLKPYPAYGDSGVEWLGALPQGWEVRRMKTLLRERVERERPDQPLLAATQSEGVIPKDSYEQRTVVATGDLSLLKLVRKGDFVISLRSFQGGIEYSRAEGIISPAYTVLYPRDPVYHPYLALVFKSSRFVDGLRLFVTGIRQGQNIDYDRLARSPLPVPPAADQAAIARFLTHVLGRIRRFITAKERLLELLEEEQRGIIHRTVTRGLEADVALRPSGIDWLGEMPEGWDAVPLHLRYSVRLGKMLDAKRITGAFLVPYLRNTDVQWDRVNSDGLPEMDIPPEQYGRYTVSRGDLLVCEGGEVGRAAIWDRPEVVGYQKALHRLRPHRADRDEPRFLYYVLRAMAERGVFKADGSESTIAHLTAEKLRRHRVPLPPIAEQRAIVESLDRELEEREKTIAVTSAQVDLLREYRTRLVADVVSGKLDVRAAAEGLPEDPGAGDSSPDERLRELVAT